MFGDMVDTWRGIRSGACFGIMPFAKRTIVMSRLEFVSLATQPGSNLRQLCRNFGISPTTSYKWIMRYERGDAAELRDRCRRPRNSPNRASAAYCRGSKLRVGLWREESGCVTRGAVGVAWIFSQFLPNWMRAEFLPACKVAFDVRSTRDVAQVWQVWPRERLSEHNRIDADLLHYFDLAGVEHVHLGKSSLFTVTLVIAHFENAGRDSFFRKRRGMPANARISQLSIRSNAGAAFGTFK